jgi:hypothetical protein
MIQARAMPERILRERFFITIRIAEIKKSSLASAKAMSGTSPHPNLAARKNELLR